MNSIKINNVFGLKLIIHPSAIICSILLELFLIFAGIQWLSLTVLDSVVGACVAIVLYWIASLGHHYGHAIAAKRTGYAMSAIRPWMLLGKSLYPKDEPDLPAEIHIQRALGGPVFSLTLSAVAGALVWATRPGGGLPYYLMLFFFWINFLIFGLGALLPLGFTDGSTLLYWLPRRDKPST